MRGISHSVLFFFFFYVVALELWHLGRYCPSWMSLDSITISSGWKFYCELAIALRRNVKRKITRYVYIFVFIICPISLNLNISLNFIGLWKNRLIKGLKEINVQVTNWIQTLKRLNNKKKLQKSNVFITHNMKFCCIFI